MEPDRWLGGRVPGGLARDLMGTLVHHLEAHVFQHRDALGEGNRLPVAPYLEPDAVVGFRTCRLICLLLAPVNVDPERAVGGERLDQPDVLECGGGRIGFPIALIEGIAVLRQQRARARRVIAARELLAERVDPGAHNRLDAVLERAAIGIGCVVVVARDNEMHTRERPFREERIEGTEPALVHLGEVLADSRTHGAAVALARHIDED